jgi:restriction system protein
MRSHRGRSDAALARYRHAEAQRIEDLNKARDEYRRECEAREREVAARNAELEKLVANLGYGAADAVQEYVAIVMANSVYPDHFPVSHEAAFDPATAELHLTVAIPDPSTIATTKSFKYSKASDEIVATELPQKAIRDRYAGVVQQVALRSFHEVFESDRRALIRTVALDVGTQTIDPATGRSAFIPFVIAGAEREAFLSIDLSGVVPAMMLERLGASVSKNPYGLQPALVKGIRRS